jgi:hypothetical protein
LENHDSDSLLIRLKENLLERMDEQQIHPKGLIVVGLQCFLVGTAKAFQTAGGKKAFVEDSCHPLSHRPLDQKAI